MIDVFCVLLIFFIVATTFRRTLPAVTISLPKAKASTSINQTDPIIITIAADEKVLLNSKEMPLTELSSTLLQLGKQSPQPALAMEADKKAPWGLVLKVMDAVKTAGFSQTSAFIDQEPKEKP